MGTIIFAYDNKLDLASFHDSLIEWGQNHFRSFPWRITQDPYKIIIAEIMLHRTQAIQVLPVYERFIKIYPTVLKLKEAEQETLNKILFPLGLKWRIYMIHEMIIELGKRFNNKVPRNKANLMSLPGVSNYIASAVRCFAWNLPEALIDTNTVRIVGRLFGLEVKDSSRRNGKFIELLSTLVDPISPRSYNYSMLDLAEAICTIKKSPDCYNCPVRDFCLYGRTS